MVFSRWFSEIEKPLELLYLQRLDWQHLWPIWKISWCAERLSRCRSQHIVRTISKSASRQTNSVQQLIQDGWLGLNFHTCFTKSPFAYKKIEKNAIKASKQGAIACITDDHLLLQESKLEQLSKTILNNRDYTKDEVHWVVNGKLYKYNSLGKIQD